MRTLHNYHQVWQQYGFTPEFYYITQNEAGSGRESYPLRPELIESIMYLYRSTGDPFLLEAGEDILKSIKHSAKTPCGYATVCSSNISINKFSTKGFYRLKTYGTIEKKIAWNLSSYQKPRNTCTYSLTPTISSTTTVNTERLSIHQTGNA